MYRKYQSGKMTTTKSYRITALEKLGIFVSKWDIRFNQLRKYKEMWGHCNVPTRNHSELKQLGEICYISINLCLHIVMLVYVFVFPTNPFALELKASG